MIEMLFGHLVGDYFLQNNWIAQNKGKYSVAGWLICILHCSLYTISVCWFMGDFRADWMVLVFCSHFFIDKFALADKYARVIRSGGCLTRFFEKVGDWDTPKKEGLTAAFCALVYVVIDNSAHLMIMYYGYKLL